MKRPCFWKKVRTVLTGQMEKVRIFPFSKKEGGGAADSIPGHIVWRCHGNRVHIIRRRVVWIGGSVFNSPSGRMVQLKEDGAVSRTPLWYECLFIKPGCIWKWAPWFWVWGREGTVREVRKARQRLVWRCHSDRCASLRPLCACIWAHIWILCLCANEIQWMGNTEDGVWMWGNAGCTWCHSGIIISLVCAKMDESLPTQPCLLGQYLWVNKSCWDDCDTVKGNLLVFFPRGLDSLIWVEEISYL